MKIAFIGLGNMGLPMAANLHRAGRNVIAFDLSASALAAAKEMGITTAQSAKEAAQGANVVISMLPAGAHVESLYIGENGLLSVLENGSLIIDCSTIATSSALKVSAAAEKAGIRSVDAPVSGGTGGAKAGTLTFMTGGSAADFEAARPILENMGQNIYHAGPAGAGQSTKICNNMLLAIQMIGTAEALALGKASGLDPAVLSEIMKRSSGGNWVLEKYNPVPGVMENVPSSKNYEGGFGTDLMLKDLNLSQEASASLKASTPLGALARSLYAAHSLSGKGQLDFSSILNLISKPDA